MRAPAEGEYESVRSTEKRGARRWQSAESPQVAAPASRRSLGFRFLRPAHLACPFCNKRSDVLGSRA